MGPRGFLDARERLGAQAPGGPQAPGELQVTSELSSFDCTRSTRRVADLAIGSKKLKDGEPLGTPKVGFYPADGQGAGPGRARGLDREEAVLC